MYEAGIPDHHKMIFSILRKAFAKGKPKTSFYCCYKYNQNDFNEAQNTILQPNLSFGKFIEIFQSMLDALAPYKQMKIRYS